MLFAKSFISCPLMSKAAPKCNLSLRFTPKFGRSCAHAPETGFGEAAHTFGLTLAAGPTPDFRRSAHSGPALAGGLFRSTLVSENLLQGVWESSCGGLETQRNFACCISATYLAVQVHNSSLFGRCFPKTTRGIAKDFFAF